MQTPPKGDYSGVPLNIEGRKMADRWDRAEAAREPCRAYGAPAIMRAPTRLRIEWRGDDALEIRTDWGSQTRTLSFRPAPRAGSKPSLQGRSLAAWEGTQGELARGREPGGARNLIVTTTGLQAGYLRRNGVPYSAGAQLTEYFDVIPRQPNGDEWLVVTSIVNDASFLTEPFVTSSHFKREADGARWHPTPCTVE
jgi:hypothetical protein